MNKIETFYIRDEQFIQDIQERDNCKKNPEPRTLTKNENPFLDF